MRKVVLIGALPLLLLGTAAVVWRASRAGAAGTGDGRPPGGDAVASLTDEVRSLRRDLAQVKAQAAHAAAREQDAQKPAADPGTGEAPPARKPLTTEERKARTRLALQQWYTTIDSHFASEGSDPSWSAEAVSGSQALMAKHTENGSLKSAQCNRSMCKVVVTHADGDAQRMFASEMADEPLLDTEVVYKYDTDVTPPATTMWIARKGHPLPRARRN